MMPYYRNFSGAIEHRTDGSGLAFVFHGVVKKLSSHKVEITELPFRKWTRDYKNFLEELVMREELIKDVREMHTDDRVHFILETRDAVNDIEDLKKMLKLTSNVSGNNMVLFDSQHRIKRYQSETEILEEFFGMRLDLYKARKSHMLKHLKKEVSTLNSKQKFILALLDGSLVIKDLDKKSLI